jgi:hypothetical protein
MSERSVTLPDTAGRGNVYVSVDRCGDVVFDFDADTTDHDAVDLDAEHLVAALRELGVIREPERRETPSDRVLASWRDAAKNDPEERRVIDARTAIRQIRKAERRTQEMVATMENAARLHATARHEMNNNMYSGDFE